MRESNPFRPWHYLTENKGNSIPSSVLFFDTETIPEVSKENPDIKVHKLRLWQASYSRLEKGIQTRRSTMGGTTAAHFWKWVGSKMHPRKTIWAFAHNLIFDATMLRLWDELDIGSLRVRANLNMEAGANRRKKNSVWDGLVVLRNPPVIIECCREIDGARIIFLDTFNWFRSSLADLGASIGLPKALMPDFAAPDSDWSKYCKRDVEILEKVMTDFILMVRREDLGNFRYTASGQAMSLYRHKFHDKRIVIHGHRDAVDLEREAYYGGECRVFKQIKVVQAYDSILSGESSYIGNSIKILTGPIYVYDCQSFYPAMMKKHIYPCRLRCVHASPSLLELEAHLQECMAVARVQIDSPNEDFPLRDKGKTIAARGRFVTTLCTPELDRAVKIGAIHSVGAMALYDGARLFAEYVDYCFTMRLKARKEGDQCQELLWKLIANSLFGKFGQRAMQWIAEPTKHCPDGWGHWTELYIANNCHNEFRAIAWQAQKEQPKGENKDSFPAIPAHVTAYGREHMRRLRDIAGEANCYYQDTDSLHVNEYGSRRLIATDQVQDGVIGKLRLQSVVQEAEYIAPKHYWHDGQWTIAGIKRNAQYLGNETFRQQQWTDINQLIEAIPPIHATTVDVTVDRSNDEIPGSVDEYGTVRTFVFNQW